MLSSKAKYALRAALYLADHDREEGWAQAVAIAEAESIPRKFLEAIMVELRDNGLVESRRGPHGGHRLTRRPEEITAADIIRLIDGPLAPTPCASRTRFGPCADCTDVRTCRLRKLMQNARDAVAGVLEHCSLAELAATRPDNIAPRPAPTRRKVPARQVS